MAEDNTPAVKHTAEEREDAAAHFGWSLALVNSNPEIKKVFKRALDKGYTADRFVAEIRDTKWFKTHAESWRTNETLRLTDPATWEAKKNQATAQARDAAAHMGAVLGPKQLDRFVNNVMMFGWDASQQADVLAGYVKLATGGQLKGQYIGDAGKNASALRETATRNGYRIPDGKLGEWNRAIIRGDATVEDYQKFIRRQAAAAFPTFHEELLAGADLDDLAAPYKQSMARLLEMNEGEIDLFNPKIRRAMASKDPKTGKPTATPLYEFEDQLRQDPRWMKTDNAHAEVLGKGRQILNAMGLTAI